MEQPKFGQESPSPVDRREILEKSLAGLESEQREAIEDVGYRLEQSLASYMNRPESDPKIIERTKDLINELSHTLAFDNSERPLSNEKKRDAEAGLLGAKMVLTPGRDRGVGMTEVYTPYEVGLGRRFLDLVDKRVGKIDATDSNKSEINMRTSEDQRVPSVKHEKKS